MTELHVDSTAYRYIIIPLDNPCLLFIHAGFPTLTSMEQNTLKVAFFYAPFGMMIHCLEN